MTLRNTLICADGARSSLLRRHEFGQETRELFARHGIETRIVGKVIVVVGVKLAA